VCGVLRAGVRHLVNNSPIFNLRGDFYHPAFLPVPSSYRENHFWRAGFWSAFHLITLLLTPDPISPWLLYAAVYGKEGLPKDLDYIRALDPTSANILEPWFAFKATEILHDGVLGPIQQLLMQYLDVHEVCYLLSDSCEEVDMHSSLALSDVRVLIVSMVTQRKFLWLLSSWGRPIHGTAQNSKHFERASMYIWGTDSFSRFAPSLSPFVYSD
jgi:hypothetical protein